MGKVNLLKANYIGKVGATYGERQRRNTYLKQIPFSHAPRTLKQKMANTAFVRLNRFASCIARNAWELLGLSDKSVYRNNAVASWLKFLIAEKTFNPFAFEKLYPNNGMVSVATSVIGENGEYITGIFRNNLVRVGENFIICFICNEQGKVYQIDVENPGISQVYMNQAFESVDFCYLYLGILAFTNVRGKMELTYSCITRRYLLIYEQATIYLDRINWGGLCYFEDGQIYASQSNSKLVGETVYLWCND